LRISSAREESTVLREKRKITSSAYIKNLEEIRADKSEVNRVNNRKARSLEGCQRKQNEEVRNDEKKDTLNATNKERAKDAKPVIKFERKFMIDSIE